MLPILGLLTIDPLHSVRSHALSLLKAIIEALEKESETAHVAELEAAQNQVQIHWDMAQMIGCYQVGAIGEDSNQAQNATSNSGGDWTSWAVKGSFMPASICSKLGHQVWPTWWSRARTPLQHHLQPQRIHLNAGQALVN